MDKAQSLINEGKITEANAVMDEVKELDNSFEAEAVATANLKALERTPEGVNNFGAGAAMDNTVSVADRYDTVEYRTAFMNLVAHDVPMVNEAGVTTTTDGAAVIPTTLVKEIVREMKACGNLYAKARKLNVQGGVEFPILTLKPTANWIGETTEEGKESSKANKVKADKKVSFSYHGIECKISQSLLANVVSLSEFEALFVPLAVEAITIKIEVAMISGDGDGKPLGITKDTRIPAANVITLSEDEISSWSAWKKKVFAKMKKAYRNGDFIMAQGTFDGYIDGMVDSTGQPIGRVNYGIEGGESYRFGGKSVETVEEDVLAAYDSASEGDVIAVFGALSNYGINSNLQMTTTRWIDNDSNEVKTKVMMILDGKIIDPSGFLIIKKGAASAQG